MQQEYLKSSIVAGIDFVHILFTFSSHTFCSDSNRAAIQRESDMSAFIWCESANDLPSMETWLTSAQKTFRDGGGLLMKAHGFTPIVQKYG